MRLSQHELNSVLETLKREYPAIILDLAGTAKAKLLRVVRGMIKQAGLQPLPKDWENHIGKNLSFFHIYPSDPSLDDLEPTSLDIDELSFQEIRGMINTRQLTLFNRQFSIEIDTLRDRFKNEIIDPWIGKLKEEGERTLLGITETRFKAAKDLMTSALVEKEERCKRELDEKDDVVGEERVEHLTAICCNLLAAEEALEELFGRVEALQTRSVQ